MKILFQGDSITDAGRDREDFHNLGDGYPKFVAQKLAQMYPDKVFEFINLGISGHKTSDLVARWQTDCLDIKPDILSILIGINDIWHYFSGKQPYVSNEAFEKNYRYLLTSAKEKTNAKIIMIDPFLLDAPDKAHFRTEVSEKIALVRKLAREFADVYVPIDGLFAAQALYHEPCYFSADGVHPNDNGRAFIANFYVEALKKLI